MDNLVFPLGSLGAYKYVVILSRYNGQLLLSRHKERDTWESQGGHIEAGESPMEAAKRELYEESGATEYDIRPLFDYRYGGSGGVVFQAEITALGPLPESEMAEVRTFPALPENLTYPLIYPVLYRAAGLT